MSDETQAATPQGSGSPPATPELDKMKKARDEGHSEDIAAFLEWLGENGMSVCSWREGIGGGRWYEIDGGINRLLARYFQIDLDKVEQERMALLDYVRRQSS